MKTRIVMLIFVFAMIVVNTLVYSYNHTPVNLWVSGLWTGMLICLGMDFYHNDWKNRNRS